MTKAKFKPNPIDVRLGELLRTVRVSCGVSQEQLGTENGLTFQQIQKYERGSNRVSVSRLIHLAKSLQVPATWFVESLCDGAAYTEDVPDFGFANLSRREIQELLQAYSRIMDKEQRRFLRHIITLLAAHKAGDGND
jgi:transcriptional regulator with XRE-family HTH domain